MKRAFDVSACALFLLFFWPILLAVIIVIRLQSPGKAIFTQVRVGKDGHTFICYKLRTMYSGTAILPTHEVQASAVTALGEARRRLGVLKMRPGITGLAQVRGVDMSDSIRLAEIDAQYVRTQSLLGDFRLIWATLRGQGVGVDQVVRSDK